MAHTHEQNTRKSEPRRAVRRVLRAQDLGPPTGLRERYEAYVSSAVTLRWKVKSFDEWLNS